MAVKSRQAGMSIITLIFILAVLAAVGAVALQAFPSVIEYQAALRAINKAKNEGTVAAVRAAFDRSADIDTITSISSKDLEITKDGDPVAVLAPRATWDRKVTGFARIEVKGPLELPADQWTYDIENLSAAKKR